MVISLRTEWLSRSEWNCSVRIETKCVSEWRQMVCLLSCCRGRYSIVRQCVHLPTGDPCAAKLISTKFIAHDRALHEYALVSSIRHDSIVRVFHLIESNSFSIIICELCELETPLLFNKRHHSSVLWSRLESPVDVCSIISVHNRSSSNIKLRNTFDSCSMDWIIYINVKSFT